MIKTILGWMQKYLDWYNNTVKLETRTIIAKKKISELFIVNNVFLGDDKYNTTTIFSMTQFLKVWQKYIRYSQKKWSKSFDCDNFSDIFMGFAKLTNPTQAIGTIWVKQTQTINHALNFFVYRTTNKTFGWAYIEPQTGEIYELNNKKVLNWRPYYVRI